MLENWFSQLQSLITDSFVCPDHIYFLLYTLIPDTRIIRTLFHVPLLSVSVTGFHCISMPMKLCEYYINFFFNKCSKKYQRTTAELICFTDLTTFCENERCIIKFKTETKWRSAWHRGQMTGNGMVRRLGNQCTCRLPIIIAAHQ